MASQKGLVTRGFVCPCQTAPNSWYSTDLHYRILKSGKRSATAILLFRLDRLDEAERAATRASDLLAEAKLIQDDTGVPTVELVVNNRARIIGHARRTGEALQLLQPLVDLSRQRGPDVQSALVIYHQSELLLLDGDPSRAAEEAREVMEMSQDLELSHLECSARLYYVHALCDLGETARARAAVEPLVQDAAAVGESS